MMASLHRHVSADLEAINSTHGRLHRPQQQPHEAVEGGGSSVAWRRCLAAVPGMYCFPTWTCTLMITLGPWAFLMHVALITIMGRREHCWQQGGDVGESLSHIADTPRIHAVAGCPSCRIEMSSVITRMTTWTLRNKAQLSPPLMQPEHALLPREVWPVSNDSEH